MENSMKKGMRDGVPIALGYFSVSFTIGIMAVATGLTPFQAVFLSLTNVTSAGEVAGLTAIGAGASCLELAMTQLIVNLRYALMSLALSQRLAPAVTTLERMLIAFGNTDEIFAVAVSQPKRVGTRYMVGLMSIPIIGWTAGTLAGAVASTLLPEMVRSALGIAVYGMFIAIVVPPMKKSRSISVVVAIAIAISAVLYYVPLFSFVSSGFSIIICTVAAAAAGAVLFPIAEEVES